MSCSFLLAAGLILAYDVQSPNGTTSKNRDSHSEQATFKRSITSAYRVLTVPCFCAAHRPTAAGVEQLREGGATSPTPAQVAKVYISPDHTLSAAASDTDIKILRTPSPTIRTKILASTTLTKEYSIHHVAWIPDSQFLIIGTEAKNGHQPWARPVWIYSRQNNQFIALSKWGITATSDFTLTAPDHIELNALDCQHNPIMLATNVSQLLARAAVPPCAIASH